jgi:hypothetical protein
MRHWTPRLQEVIEDNFKIWKDSFLENTFQRPPGQGMGQEATHPDNGNIYVVADEGRIRESHTNLLGQPGSRGE